MPKPKKTEVSSLPKDKLQAAKPPKLKAKSPVSSAIKPAGKAPKAAAAPIPAAPAKAPKISSIKPVKTIHSTSTPAPAKVAPVVSARVRKTTLTAPEPVPARPVFISNEAIAERAYYIAERRISMGWPGDSESDWIEAETQLRAEKSIG